MSIYAVIDTNVLVSALLKKHSIPYTVFQYINDGIIIPIVSETIVGEYWEVLSRPKFKFEYRDIDFYVTTILNRAVFARGDSLDEVLPDPKDQVFYEVVMEKRKDEDAYLVTGNMKHFPPKPFIVTPSEMIAIVSGLLKS